MSILTIYHGSDKKIERPEYKKGKKTNDYGIGFYCTQHYELACEWAAKSRDVQGWVNKYSIDTKELKILDLTDKKYSILNWLAILLENRTFTLTSPISIQAKDYILKHFKVDVSGYDIIKGYRADDSYFSFAEDFLNNIISLQHLGNAMKLGKLGIQHVIISENAFNKLNFELGEEVNQEIYYNKYCQRDLKAREDYSNSKIDLSINSNELYVRDIIMEGIKNGDPRL